MTPSAVGLLHPGEMGASVGGALLERGNRVEWASEGRSPQSTARAEQFGLVDAGSIDRLLERVEVIVSVCPPSAALQVAGSVAKAGFRGLYLDANAVAPSTARAVRDQLRAAGATFVDGAIIGGPLRPASRTRLYLSGDDAAAMAALFEGSDWVEVEVLDEGPVAASALKMCFAAWSKGTSALVLAIAAAAQALGVEGALHREWRRSQPGLPERMEGARRTGPRAWRFTGEMEEIGRCFTEVGVPDQFPLAAADVYRRLSRLKGTEADLETILGCLVGRPESEPPI